jgi:uncharacterized protein (TIGR00725 family)
MTDRARVITVFGSSRPCEGDSHYALARELGESLAKRGFVVCSGGYGGVMEAASRGAKEAGGKTLAVTAEFFRARANPWVDEEVRVKTWQQRLFELIQRGSGYVACRGGTGTLVELAVVWEMLNKRVMRGKPFVALGDFWEPIIERIREVELGYDSPWGEGADRIVHISVRPAEAAEYLGTRIFNEANVNR